MRVAVLSLTRDRLEYTKWCFEGLSKYAGCEYDHYVLDQGSTDGTQAWLHRQWLDGKIKYSHPLDHNVGISRGMNTLLSEFYLTDRYDVIVKFDNDCELIHENTLKDVARLCLEGGCLLSPRILGLNNPPPVIRQLVIGDETILDVPQIGGIFLAAPAWVYDDFRYSDANPVHGNDDVEICAWFRQQGGTCGYVKRLEAWHHESTNGQHERYPEYFARTLAEGKPCL